MNYLILEYEQDETKDETFKDSSAHNLFYDEDEAIEYIEKNGIYGKIEVYDDNEWDNYMNDVIDDVPECVRIIEW